MKEGDAIKLIREGILPAYKPLIWADLGCGSGTFTKALAELLPAGSTILAIDKEAQQFYSSTGISIQFRQADFTKPDVLPLNLDGALLANSLHYVSDQANFLGRLSKSLNPGGRLIIVEYDTDQASQWVPYPLHFSKLKMLLTGAGFVTHKLGEINSVYNRNKIYASVAFRND